MWPWIDQERLNAISQAKAAISENINRSRDDQANQIVAIKEKIRAAENKTEFFKAQIQEQIDSFKRLKQATEAKPVKHHQYMKQSSDNKHYPQVMKPFTP